MAVPIKMPRLSTTMEEGTLTHWLKSSGELVAKGEPLLMVETDKAELEVESEGSGILQIVADEYQVLPVGAILAYLVLEGEVAVPDGRAGGAPEAMIEASPLSAAAATMARPARVAASPAARRVAAERGVDLALVRGSAPDGSIVERDVLAYAEQQAEVLAVPPPAPTPAPAALAASTPLAETDEPVVALNPVRRAGAERLSVSFATAPHFYLGATADMTEAVRLRQMFDPKPSFTAIILRAAASVLAAHPEVNLSFRDGGLVKHTHVNLGVAIATADGLLVPVLHDADRLRLVEIDRRLSELRERANARRFKADEFTGGTFTISNLGMFGVEEFLAVINPPEAAILAVGAIVDRPCGGAGGVELRPSMRLNLSIDHRALDGAEGARFLGDLKGALERPYVLL